MNSKEFFKDKNILYIVHTYSDFQKDPIDEIAKYFNKVYVIVRHKPISSIIGLLPITWLKKYDESLMIDFTNVPKNVEVLKSPVWYLPFGLLYKLSGLFHYWAVDKVIRKNKIEFDMIHSHFIWSAGYVGMKLKKKYHKPLVVTGHGFDVYDLPFQDSYWNKIVRKILDSTDLILTVSKKNLESLKKLGIKDSNVTVLENGYDSEIFYPLDKRKVRESLGIKQDDKIVVAVGSLENIKGHKYLIEAISLLQKKYKNLKCYIVGGGSLEHKLRVLIKELDLETKVFLLGHIPHAQVNNWMNASDLFVMPSLNEGLPVVMLEALGCGKPFVGSNVGGIPEVINSDRYGILVRSKDPIQLSNAIDISLTKNWDEEAIMKYGSKFTVKNLVSRTLDSYLELFKDND